MSTEVSGPDDLTAWFRARAASGVAAVNVPGDGGASGSATKVVGGFELSSRRYVASFAAVPAPMPISRIRSSAPFGLGEPPRAPVLPTTYVPAEAAHEQQLPTIDASSAPGRAAIAGRLSVAPPPGSIVPADGLRDGVGPSFPRRAALSPRWTGVARRNGPAASPSVRALWDPFDETDPDPISLRRTTPAVLPSANGDGRRTALVTSGRSGEPGPMVPDLVALVSDANGLDALATNGLAEDVVSDADDGRADPYVEENEFVEQRAERAADRGSSDANSGIEARVLVPGAEPGTVRAPSHGAPVATPGDRPTPEPVRPPTGLAPPPTNSLAGNTRTPGTGQPATPGTTPRQAPGFDPSRAPGLGGHVIDRGPDFFGQTVISKGKGGGGGAMSTAAAAGAAANREWALYNKLNERDRGSIYGDAMRKASDAANARQQALAQFGKNSQDQGAKRIDDAIARKEHADNRQAKLDASRRNAPSANDARAAKSEARAARDVATSAKAALTQLRGKGDPKLNKLAAKAADSAKKAAKTAADAAKKAERSAKYGYKENAAAAAAKATAAAAKAKEAAQAAAAALAKAIKEALKKKEPEQPPESREPEDPPPPPEGTSVPAGGQSGADVSHCGDPKDCGTCTCTGTAECECHWEIEATTSAGGAGSGPGASGNVATAGSGMVPSGPADLKSGHRSDAITSLISLAGGVLFAPAPAPPPPEEPPGKRTPPRKPRVLLVKLDDRFSPAVYAAKDEKVRWDSPLYSPPLGADPTRGEIGISVDARRQTLEAEGYDVTVLSFKDVSAMNNFLDHTYGNSTPQPKPGANVQGVSPGANVQGESELVGSAAGEAGRHRSSGFFSRIDEAIKARARAYREARGIDLYEMSDPSLPPPDPSKYATWPRGSLLNESRHGITTAQGQVLIAEDLAGERLRVVAGHEVYGHLPNVPSPAAPVLPGEWPLMGGEGMTAGQAMRQARLDRSALSTFFEEASAHSRGVGGDRVKGLLYAIEYHLASGPMTADAARLLATRVGPIAALTLLPGDSQESHPNGQERK